MSLGLPWLLTLLWLLLRLLLLCLLLIDCQLLAVTFFNLPVVSHVLSGRAQTQAQAQPVVSLLLMFHTEKKSQLMAGTRRQSFLYSSRVEATSPEIAPYGSLLVFVLLALYTVPQQSLSFLMMCYCPVCLSLIFVVSLDQLHRHVLSLA